MTTEHLANVGTPGIIALQDDNSEVSKEEAQALDDAIETCAKAIDKHGNLYAEAVVNLAAHLRRMRRTRAYMHYDTTFERYLERRHAALSADRVRRLVVALDELGHNDLQHWLRKIGERGCFWLALIKQADEARYREVLITLRDLNSDDGATITSLQRIAHEAQEQAQTHALQAVPVRAQLPVAQRKAAAPRQPPADRKHASHKADGQRRDDLLVAMIQNVTQSLAALEAEPAALPLTLKRIEPAMKELFVLFTKLDDLARQSNG